MQADDCDRRCDAGGDVTADRDLPRASRPGLGQRRVNVDFPLGMIEFPTSMASGFSAVALVPPLRPQRAPR